MHVVAPHQLIANTPAGITGAIVTSATVSWRCVLVVSSPVPFLGGMRNLKKLTPAVIFSALEHPEFQVSLPAVR
jgi:alpha/beta superfamily hydrolase